MEIQTQTYFNPHEANSDIIEKKRLVWSPRAYPLCEPYDPARELQDNDFERMSQDELWGPILLTHLFTHRLDSDTQRPIQDPV